MARLRYNNQNGTLGAALTNSGTTITFTSAPDFATIVSPDYIPLYLDVGTSSFEIVYLTAYTASATTGTITRAAEDSTHWPAVAHNATSGTWSSSSSVQDWNITRTVINVQEFGAVGNGVADDSAAINQALVECPIGGQVFVPSTGTFYGVGANPITVPSYKALVGSKGFGDLTGTSATNGASLRMLNGANLSCVVGSQAYVNAPTVTGCTASGTSLTTTASFTTAGIYAGMSVNGTGVTSGTTVVTVNSATNLTLSAAATSSAATLTFGRVVDFGVEIRDLIVDGNSVNQTAGNGHGIATCSWRTTIEKNWIYSPRGDGIYCANNTAGNFWAPGNAVEMRISNNIIDFPGGHGFEVFENANGGGLVTDGWFLENSIEGPTLDGIHMADSGGWNISNNHPYSCGANTAYISGPWNTVVSGNYWEQPGAIDQSGPVYGCLIDMPNAGQDCVYANNHCILISPPVAGNTYYAHYIRTDGGGSTMNVAYVGNTVQGYTTTPYGTGHTLSAGSGDTLKVASAGNTSFTNVLTPWSISGTVSLSSDAFATNTALLARAAYAPTTAASHALVVSTTGLTAIDTTNLVVTFVAPPSGTVRVNLSAFVAGGAAAGTKTMFGVVSTTGSPGTIAGTVALVNETPTATAADNGQICHASQLITGLTPGSSHTWYFAGSYSGTQTSIVVQGGSTVTTVPTGAPAVIEVISA